jgi:citrate synthase
MTYVRRNDWRKYVKILAMSEDSAKLGVLEPGVSSTRDEIFAETPRAPDYNPVGDAIKRANELGEKQIAAVLGYFASMPQSTAIIANPVLHHTPVDCNGTEITLDIRSFTIRGLLPEAEIVRGQASPFKIIFTGLFDRLPSGEDEKLLAAVIDRQFFVSLDLERGSNPLGQPVIDLVARFLREFPCVSPELSVQHLSVRRKAQQEQEPHEDHGINEDRDPELLLREMIAVHMENVAIGVVSAYMAKLQTEDRALSANNLADAATQFIHVERERGRNAFQTSYSLLLGRHANDAETLVMEKLGSLQVHHGSAGSNMVARYMTTLHTLSVSDFFGAAQMAMEGARHFGAIRDITFLIQKLEGLSADERAKLIRDRLLGGGLPGFGHPEISAAGRSNHVQQDPRPAIYIEPLLNAIDRGQLTLDDYRRQRLDIAEQVYKLAFVKGVVKPNRENEPPLRLTPNTDFGAWYVQEALGIAEDYRTLLTFIFRGFGWMMDAREQLLQKIIRPVIAPDPRIVPAPDGDQTIPEAVLKMHRRFSGS